MVLIYVNFDFVSMFSSHCEQTLITNANLSLLSFTLVDLLREPRIGSSHV